MDDAQLIQELTDERPFSRIAPSLVERLKMEDEIKRRQTEWKAVEREVLSNGVVGTTLTNGKGLYAVITPDCEKGYRYTTFNLTGFLGHGTYATAVKALSAAFRMGLHCVADRSALDFIMSQGELVNTQF